MRNFDMSNPFEKREQNRYKVIKQIDDSRYNSIVKNDVLTYWIKEAWNEPPLKWIKKYPDKTAQLTYERFLLLKDIFQFFLSNEFKDYDNYDEGCEIIRDKLPEIEEAINYFEGREDVQTGMRIFDDEFDDLTAPNIQQGVSFKCLDVIKQLSRKHTKRGVHFIFKEAYKEGCCQSEVKDGVFKKIGSYRTLMERVKANNPEIYKGAEKKG